MKKTKNKPSFEESLPIIDEEIKKRRSKWTLTALSWMDFNDVAQILRIHIYNKWSLYDSSQPLKPWVNTIISNQITNLIRNNYSNYSRPCLKCAAAEGENLCHLYGTQCNMCPLYAYWEKRKKNAYNIKLPVSMENHLNEVFEMESEAINVESTAKNIHNYMKKTLKPLEYEIYRLLYIEHKTELDVAKSKGYKTSEQNRSPGYKHIKNIKKTIINKIKQALIDGDIDIVHE